MDHDVENLPPLPEIKKENSGHVKTKKKHRVRIWLLSILAVLIIARLCLPYFVLRYVNNKLAGLSEYYGKVDDIDIALLRGAYVIKDLKIEKLEEENSKKDTTPFFTCPVIDLSVEWKALFKGSVVGEIYLEDPVLNFVKGKHKNENVKADTADFRKLIKDLMPLTVNHFEITNGQIHYIDKNISPAIDISMKDVMAVATNLSNVNDSAKVLPAHLQARGHAYEGDFRMDVDFDALNKVPTFDLNAELNNLKLTDVNSFFKAYGDFEIKSGRFGLYAEFASKNGSYGGYVKPLLKDVKVVQGAGNIKQELWEMLVGAAAKLLENPSKKQVGTKVSIEGKFDSGTSVNLWRAISYVLRNAFVHALKPSIDNSINIDKLEDDEKKTFLEKLFGKKNKKKKNK